MLDIPNYNIKLDSNYIVLYHNTTSKNIDSIIKNGIKATAGRTQGRGLDGDFVWATSTPNLKGYGGNTVAFKIKKDIAEQYKVNSDEYTIPFDIPAPDILFIDRYIVDNYRLSDIPNIVNKYGKDKVIKVYTNRQDKFVNGYTLQDLINIIDSLKTTKTESRTKIEEASRNELLVKAKSQTITRYKKSAGYKGFSIIDIDTTSVFTTNSLRVTCRVGDYWDTVEMQNILYWIQLEAEKNSNYQINTKGVTAAIMNSIDGMDIKVDCSCSDFKYRFAYMATKLKYKYGKPENRPAKITNPHDYGSMCKHLISMLSNKKWLQQTTGTVMDFIVDRIDDVNKYLRPNKGEELTLPNELARQNAKAGFYSKLFKDKQDEEEPTQEEEQNNENVQEEPTTNDKDIQQDNLQQDNSNNEEENV